MTRATRFAAISTFSTVVYFLALFQFFSVPLVDDNVVQEILPVVSISALILQGHTFNFGSVDPLVAAGVVRLIFSVVNWMGTVHV